MRATSEILNAFKQEGVKVLATIPQGWVVNKEATTAPQGYVWVWNLKNPFKDNKFEHALLKVYDKEQWNKDGVLKLQVGTVVDSEVYYQLLGCVPPAYNGFTYFQVGEAESHTTDGQPLYTTFTKVSDEDYWKYIGIRVRKDFTDNGIERPDNDLFKDLI